MPPFPTSLLRWRVALALVIAYCVTALCSHALGRVLPGYPPLYWLPAGVGLACFLLFGRSGAFLAFGCSLFADGLLHAPADAPIPWGWEHGLMALAATLQAGLAAKAWRARELVRQRRFLRHSSELGYFWLRVCLLPPLLCVPLLFALQTMLRLALPAVPAPDPLQLPYLVLAHTLGTLLLVPCLVIWRDRGEWSWRLPARQKWWSALAVPAVLALALLLHDNALVLLLPVLLAVTVHYHWPGAMLAMLLIALTLSAATQQGIGPFASQPDALRHIDLQLFLFSVGIMLQYLALGQEQLLQGRRELQREVEARTRELQLANARLAEMATTDELTGLNNRREWQRRSAETLMLARRNGEPVSLLLLDLDHFKAINDQHGHLIGDLVLRAVSNACSATLRTTDNLGRWGGEEFVVLLPGTALIEAARVAEKLRSNVAATRVSNEPLPPIHVTISIGVTTLRPDDSDLDDLIKRADDALYAAKRAGRNRVVIDAEPPDHA